MSFILSLFLLWITGAFLVLFFVKRQRYCCSMSEFLSLSFFLGTGITVYYMFIFGLLGVSYCIKNLSIIPAALSVLILSRYLFKTGRISEPGTRGVHSEPWNLTEKLLLTGIIFQFLWVIFLAFPVPVQAHDAVANYALKAKILFTLKGNFTEMFSLSEDAAGHFVHPLWLSVIVSWVNTFTGGDEFLANMIMPTIYIMFGILLYSLFRKIFNRAYSLLLLFAFITIHQISNYSGIIYADLPLTAFTTCAFVYFILYIKNENETQMLISSILFGFSLLIKNEALIFVGGYLFLFFIYAIKNNGLKRKLIFRNLISAIAVILAINVPWLIIKIVHGISNQYIGLTGLTADKFFENVRHIPVLLNSFQQEVFGPKKWNIFWILVIAGGIWKRRMLWKDEIFYITLYLVILMAGYVAGYMVVKVHNLYFYINTTLSRFMIHFSGITLLLLAFLSAKDIRELESFK